MSLKVINTKNAPAAVGPYSQAIEVDKFVYISGQIPLDPVTGKIVEGGIEEQTRRVLDNAMAILKEAGITYKNVVKTTCLLDNMGDFAAMNAIYAEYFSDHKPARAAFEVAKLPLSVMVEIEMIAYK
jgi:2-iminobutanoate/2-iminopropanoate deaminase